MASFSIDLIRLILNLHLSISCVLHLFNITLNFNDINVLKHVNGKRVISMMGHDEDNHVQVEAWNEPADKVDALVGGVTEIVVDLFNVSHNMTKDKVEIRSHSDTKIVVDQSVIVTFGYQDRRGPICHRRSRSDSTDGRSI